MPVAGRLLSVIILCATTIAVFIWQTTEFRSASEALVAYRSGLYLQPWRAITSGFIHQSAPHVLFNLVTLWIAGARTCQRYGVWWLLVVFFVSLFVGQVAHTLITQSQVVGISGGICGLYGFLIHREWQGSLVQTLRLWEFFWVYPLALLVLFVLDVVGLLSIANVSHVVAIGRRVRLRRARERRRAGTARN